MRIAVSQITTARWGFAESVENYARTDGIEGIGIWPDKLSEVGAEAGAQKIRDAGLGVSSLVFVTGFTQDLRKGIEDGRRSVQDAHNLGTDTLLVVAGPRLGVDAGEGDRLTREGLSALSGEAGEVHPATPPRRAPRRGRSPARSGARTLYARRPRFGFGLPGTPEPPNGRLLWLCARRGPR